MSYDLSPLTPRRAAIFEVISREYFVDLVRDVGVIPEESRTETLLDHADSIIRFAEMLKTGESKAAIVFTRLAHKTAATCTSLIDDHDAMLDVAYDLLYVDDDLFYDGDREAAMRADESIYHLTDEALDALIERVETEKLSITRDSHHDTVDGEMLSFALVLIGFALDAPAF